MVAPLPAPPLSADRSVMTPLDHGTPHPAINAVATIMITASSGRRRLMLGMGRLRRGLVGVHRWLATTALRVAASGLRGSCGTDVVTRVTVAVDLVAVGEAADVVGRRLRICWLGAPEDDIGRSHRKLVALRHQRQRRTVQATAGAQRQHQTELRAPAWLAPRLEPAAVQPGVFQTDRQAEAGAP